MRVSLLALLTVSSASAFVSHNNWNAVETKLSVKGMDRLVPEEVRSKRSKKIRDKLLGDMEPRFEPKGDCPLIAEQKRRDRLMKMRNKEQEHPMLNQMMHLFEQHVTEMERVDPNC